jgi:DNA-binding MarR family transcriptional regulator
MTAIRAGIEQLLIFIDENPHEGRILIVDCLRGDDATLARRAEVLDHLAEAVHCGRRQARAPSCLTKINARGAVGAVLTILHAHLTTAPDAPLAPLAGQLTGMVILPYQGPVAATRQIRRPMPDTALRAAQQQALANLDIRITDRTVRVLRALAAQHGQGRGLSNRQIADHAGINDQGQCSKLLARLARHGLIENTHRGAHRTGQANAWKLTVKGAGLEWATRDRGHRDRQPNPAGIG